MPIYRKQKLIEIAFVTIPSNEEAEILARAKALSREKELSDITERLKRIERLAEEATKESAELADEQHGDEPEVADEDVKKWRAYFEQKQPINKKASGVLKKFYARVLDTEPPADEGEAWDRIGEEIEAMKETKDDPRPEEEKPAEEAVADETPQEVAPDKSSDPTPPAEAPPAAQKASVHIPFDLLANMPASMTRSFVEVGVEALRRGITVKDAMQLIDGMNDAVSTSFNSIQHGSNH